jgi:hypothetical protein
LIGQADQRLWMGESMLSDSALIDMIRCFPTPVGYKEADTGRYVASSLANARMFGIEDPDQLIGLTIHDVQFRQQKWGARYADLICKLDFCAQDSKHPVYCRQRFLDGDGNAQFLEITKIPVMNMRRNVMGIVTFGTDRTVELTASQLYCLYTDFYLGSEAVQRVLIRLNLHTLFVSPPTDTQFRVLLYRAERYSIKEISRFLGLSPRTVDSHLRALRNKIAGGDLSRVCRFISPNGEEHAVR